MLYPVYTLAKDTEKHRAPNKGVSTTQTNTVPYNSDVISGPGLRANQRAILVGRNTLAFQAYSETLTRREIVRANASLGELRRVKKV